LLSNFEYIDYGHVWASAICHLGLKKSNFQSCEGLKGLNASLYQNSQRFGETVLSYGDLTVFRPHCSTTRCLKKFSACKFDKS